MRPFRTALAAALILAAAPAAAEPPLLGFAPSDRTLADFLQDGYVITSASLGMVFVLQKGPDAALCAVAPARHECQTSLAPAAARSAVTAARAARPPAPPAPPPRTW